MIKKYAHFGLAFVGGLLVGTAAPFTNAPALLTIIGVEFILILAFWYEWKQAVDSGLLKKYGSLTNFQKDSRSDVKQDLTGLFAGLFVGLIIISIIVRIFK